MITVKLPIPFQQLPCRYEEVISHGNALYDFIADPKNHKFRVDNKNIWEDGMIKGDYHATPHYVLEPLVQSSKLKKRFLDEFYKWSRLGDSQEVNEYIDNYVNLAKPLIQFMSDALSAFDSSKRWVLREFEVNRIVPGGYIKPHIDQHVYADKTQRVHLVLTTNPEAYIIADGIKINWPVGSCFIFNNKTLHEIQNNGHTDRTHLVADYHPLEFNSVPDSPY